MNQITNASAPIVAVFESAQSIRIIMIDNDPWFVAADVCRVLGIQNPTQVCSKLDDDERAMFNIGRQGNATVVSESGLNCIILRCNDAVKPGTIPHKFRKWVTSEVLPTIRKTGSYVVQAEPEIEPEDECRAISESESEKMRKIVQGIAHCLPTITPHKVSATLYTRIKSPLRIARIDDIPVSHYGRAMQYLERMLAVARQHNRRQEAMDTALLSKMVDSSGVVA